MKLLKLFWFACLLAAFSPLSAQLLGLEELLTIHKKTESERESYLLRKGFDFEEAEVERIKNTDVLVRYYAWKLKSHIRNSARTMIITRGKSPGNSPYYETTYITFEKYDYTSLKTLAEIKGFTYKTSKMVADRIDHIYENDKYKLVFFTSTADKVYVYGIRVVNK